MPALLQPWWQRLTNTLLLTLAAALLAGCASRPTTVWTNPALPAHWEAEGKAALRHGDKGTNVYFTWTQQADHYHIIVRGPLGLGRADLYGEPGLVRLTADNLDGELRAASLEDLLEKATRRRAPLSHALHWMKAEAATPRARVRRDEHGKLQAISEDGWTVQYLSWSEEAPLLPRKLTLQGPEGSATVIIGLWRLPSSDASQNP